MVCLLIQHAPSSTNENKIISLCPAFRRPLAPPLPPPPTVTGEVAVPRKVWNRRSGRQPLTTSKHCVSALDCMRHGPQGSMHSPSRGDVNETFTSSQRRDSKRNHHHVPVPCAVTKLNTDRTDSHISSSHYRIRPTYITVAASLQCRHSSTTTAGISDRIHISSWRTPCTWMNQH